MSWQKFESESNKSSAIIDYTVEVLKVQHKMYGSRDLVSISLVPAYNRKVNETHIQAFHEQLGMCNIMNQTFAHTTKSSENTSIIIKI